jgi:hypothetical protein
MAKTVAEWKNLEKAVQEAFYTVIDDYQPLKDEFDTLHIVDRASQEEFNNRRLVYIIIEEFEQDEEIEEKARVDKPNSDQDHKKVTDPIMTVTVKTPRATQMRVASGYVRDAVTSYDGRIELRDRNIYRPMFESNDLQPVERVDEDEGSKKFYENNIHFKFRWEGH